MNLRGFSFYFGDVIFLFVKHDGYGRAESQIAVYRERRVVKRAYVLYYGKLEPGAFRFFRAGFV